MTFLDQTAFVMALLLKVFALWFAVIALFFCKKPGPRLPHKPQTRFACLIPARNEAEVIGALVESLYEQDYPDALYDIYVLPNNCTDGTEDAARAAGADILLCAGPVRCKGDVLHQAIRQLLPLNYDAFCVFDADNIVHPAFLARMNDAFLAGARVAKGQMLAKNPYDSWVSGCYALYYGLTEIFFNRPRAALGLSVKLVGTGFAVHRNVLIRMGGWNTESIAEDAEFSAVCAAMGELIRWVPEAIAYDEAPCRFRTSLTQRKRWCSGIMRVAEKKIPVLLRRLPSVNFFRAADMLFFLCAPFAQALSPIPYLLLAVSAFVHAAALPVNLSTTLLLPLGWIGTTFLAAALARGMGLNLRRSSTSILLFPMFMASWLPLQVVSLLHRTEVWHEIRHDRTIDSRELKHNVSVRTRLKR